MKFVASSEDGIVVIEAPSEWDARQFACAELGVSEPTMRLIDANLLPADVELCWRGSDAGNHPDRHIETRRAERSGGLRVWGPWRRRVEDSIYHGRLCQADPLPNGGAQ